MTLTKKLEKEIFEKAEIGNQTCYYDYQLKSAIEIAYNLGIDYKNKEEELDIDNE